MPANPASILDTVKKLLGIDADNTDFDIEVTAHINSVFSILRQIGVGSSSGYAITDNTQLWTDFTSDIVKLALVKSYFFQKIRLWFDPPANPKVLDSMEKQVLELEERLLIVAEEITPPAAPTPVDDDDAEDEEGLIEDLEGQFLNDFGQGGDL